MDIYERLFERDKKTKYKVGDYIILNDDLEYDCFFIAEVLKVNEDMEIPDYYVLTYNKSNNNEIKFWVEDSEIVKKANSKEKQSLKNIQK